MSDFASVLRNAIHVTPGSVHQSSVLGNPFSHVDDHNLTRLVAVTTAALRQRGLLPPSHRSNATVVPPPPPRQPYFHSQAPQNPIHRVVPPPPPLAMHPTATLQQQLPITCVSSLLP
jgi:hypothetical protein